MLINPTILFTKIAAMQPNNVTTIEASLLFWSPKGELFSFSSSFVFSLLFSSKIRLQQKLTGPIDQTSTDTSNIMSVSNTRQMLTLRGTCSTRFDHFT